jgi:HemY protein
MAQIAAPTGVAMLPLIVGALEDKSSEEPIDVVETPVAEEVEVVDAEVVDVAEDAVETKA